MKQDNFTLDFEKYESVGSVKLQMDLESLLSKLNRNSYFAYSLR